jgi:hypothetical protein
MKRLREAEEVSGDEDGRGCDETRFPKVIELDDSDQTGGIEFKCSLPPHKSLVTFTTYQEYEAHYQAQHQHRCQCRKNFPSAYFLALHLEEEHSALTAVKRDRGDRTVSGIKTLTFLAITNQVSL